MREVGEVGVDAAVAAGAGRTDCCDPPFNDADAEGEAEVFLFVSELDKLFSDGFVINNSSASLFPLFERGLLANVEELTWGVGPVAGSSKSSSSPLDLRRDFRTIYKKINRRNNNHP
eukprot:m.136437 g.136437  ORF g.136437 m.136437 type:complete len:117 (+) comp14733_c0_seq3:4060-4410(+)